MTSNSKKLYERMYDYLKRRNAWVSRTEIDTAAMRAGFSATDRDAAHKALYDAPDICYRYNKNKRLWEYHWYEMSEEEIEGRCRNIAFFEED